MLVRCTRTVAALALATAGVWVSPPNASAVPNASPTVAQFDLVGPPGSETFGRNVLVLSNGNYVVVDSKFSASDTGAVYLYDGATDTVISTLTGGGFGDEVGSGGVVEVGTSDVAVISPQWDRGLFADAGAVTWIDGTTGLNGIVSISNSLVGMSMNDGVGDGDVVPLTNGNYVVTSPRWDNGGTINAGAVTWAKGDGTTTGSVTTGNSLHGTNINDRVGNGPFGNGGVVALANGNYTVASPRWNNPPFDDVGAVTWGNGTIGVTGPVTTMNSLHGFIVNDSVGSGFVTALDDGNYVISSPLWDNSILVEAGAVTWADGTIPTSGRVRTSNSLYGTSTGSLVGGRRVAALPGGAYVVVSPEWNGLGNDRGAVTRLAGGAAFSGPVTASNSLHGLNDNDFVGSGDVTVLDNGAYVVSSPSWDNGGVNNVGAVTWAAAAGLTGPVTTANSLHGETVGDRVGGGGVTGLAGGRYVVASPEWNNGTINDAGAATWSSGAPGITGPVSTANSLHGTTTNDGAGDNGVTALSDGDYTVATSLWDNGPTVEVGAVTWAPGATGLAGPITPTNSLHGTIVNDFVGDSGVVALPDGNYVAANRSWDSGPIVNAGAVTFGLGESGVTGEVSAANSVIGSPPGNIQNAGPRYTSNDAVPVPTRQNRVLLMRVDRAPFFTAQPANVSVTAAPGAPSHPATFPTPVASDLRDVAAPAVVCVPASGSPFPVGATTVTCTATDSAGTTAATSFVVTVTGVPGPTPEIVSLDPARLLDTRPDGETVDDMAEGDGLIAASAQKELPVLGRGGVPATDVGAVIVNVTAVNPDGRGFLTIHPCGTLPLASSLNYRSAGAVAGNEIVAKVSPAGSICIHTSASTHVTADVVGYVPAASNVVSSPPERFLDTRPTGDTIDDVSEGGGPIAANTEVPLAIAGRGSVPANGVDAVIVNVTAVNPEGRGFLTIHPCGQRPLASSLNYGSAGAVVGNEIVAKLSDAGTICIYTSATTHVTADVVGHVPNASTYVPATPTRLLDTRPGEATIDNVNQGDGTVATMTEFELQITGRGGVPSTGVTTAALNLTAVNPDGRGFLTVHPCGSRPLASSLNFQASGVVIGNEIIAKLSPTGKVCIYASERTHITADLVGYLPG